MQSAFFSCLLPLTLTSVFFGAACSTSQEPDGDGGSCEARSEAFEEFVAEHRACTADPDCEVIGDCGPNADFRAVRADSANEARALQVARCGQTFDGPVYRAVCTSGQCSLQMRTDTCCGCVPEDAGIGDGG